MLSRFLLAPALLVLLAMPRPGLAIDPVKVTPAPLLCAPPVSTCAPARDGGLGDCPDGHVCRCVPSCPDCKDCAAKVCVAGAEPTCRTACDCPPGLGCFDGRCIAGFAPVFCCEEGPCPTGDQCQHGDGRMDTCPQVCVDQAWRCETPGGADPACGDDRECRCTASCPTCEDCGPGVCVPGGTPPPYRCDAEHACANPGDRCQCVSSCPDCDDCAFGICVPTCAAKCADRQRQVAARIGVAVERAQACQQDSDCVSVNLSTHCRNACERQFVNRRSLPKVQRTVDRLDKNVCTRFLNDGCPPEKVHCPHKPFALRPACVEGRCVGRPKP